MKTTVQRESYSCDVCKKEDTLCRKCLGCGKDLCYDCRKEKGNAVEYPSMVNFDTSDTGVYCNSCDSQRKAGAIADPLHSAYLALFHYRTFLRSRYENDKLDQDRLETSLDKLIKERKLKDDPF